ncbi:N-acetylmuramoyl-L-alanine amidase, partial [Candidatus Daviesbacteria bacterium]|nr:N-acetylmuramoyl-L-alanine amidase [Candidatus Daviesbacteria bacterium]
MAKTNLQIQSLGNKFVDLRDLIPGDSYNWSWVRDLSQVNFLAIHHTAAPDTQTPEEIANYHIQNNGWGGIGYHFVITKDGTV